MQNQENQPLSPYLHDALQIAAFGGRVIGGLVAANAARSTIVYYAEAFNGTLGDFPLDQVAANSLLAFVGYATWARAGQYLQKHSGQPGQDTC